MVVTYNLRALFSPRSIFYGAGRLREYRIRGSLVRGESIPEQFRVERLREIVRFALRRSPYYRASLGRAGVDHELIRELEDVTRLPTVDKEILRKEARNFATAPLQRMDRSTTSGSTGVPVEFFRSARDCVYGISWERAYTLSGFDVRRIRRYRVFRLVHPVDFYGVHHPNVIEASVNDPPGLTARRLLAFAPQILEGYPSDLRVLADELAEKGPVPSPERIFSHSELLDVPSRKQIESVFGRAVTDLYGAKELGCVAWQCDQGHYHVNDDYFLLEVQRDDGTIGFSGRGELIVTALFGFGTPLLRYHLGDVVEIEGRPLPCRFRTTQVKVLEGKVYDFLRRDDGESISPHTVRQVVSAVSGIKTFQITQYRDGVVEISIVPADPENTGLPAALAPGLQRVFGPGSRICIRAVDSLRRDSSVKFKTVLRVDRDYGE